LNFILRLSKNRLERRKSWDCLLTRSEKEIRKFAAMDMVNTDYMSLSFNPANEIAQNYAMEDPMMQQHHQPSSAMPSDDAVGQNYEELFPKLPMGKGTAPKVPSARDNQTQQKMKVESSNISVVFHLPVEERRYRDASDHHFGGQGEQAKICADIMHKTGTNIEVSLAKDGSLTVLITGKQDGVEKAKKLINSQLQTQANITMDIAKDYHRFLLGKGGNRLKELEQMTGTKITIPRGDEPTTAVKIVGTKECLDKARHEINIIIEEQSKKAFERFEIPKEFHPLIHGPNGQNIAQIMERTGTRITMPPQSMPKNDIAISGEKEGVLEAKNMIINRYQQIKQTYNTISIQVKKEQHKYVIGPRGAGIQEILESGVYVDVPSNEDNNNETITLRGPQTLLGNALTLVYRKANSVVKEIVDAPTWLHRTIIGPKGANIRKIVQDLPKVHVDFVSDNIVIEGPPEEVLKASSELRSIVKDLQGRLTYNDMKVDAVHHRHIIGKSGANINRMKTDYDVQITIGGDNGNENLIRIEGAPKAVQACRKEIEQMVQKMKDEVSKEITIEQKFHRALIGNKGDNIREIRDQFPNVIITFPDTNRQSDKVILRGNKNEVAKCEKLIASKYAQIKEENFSLEVKIKKDLHRNIIGKSGATIREIREETNTKIDLPGEDTDSEMIRITGKKEDCENARKRLLKIQTGLLTIETIEVNIPVKFHNSLIGSKGAYIRSISEDCGSVQIKFPQGDSNSEKVSIRGQKEDCEKAKKMLLAITKEKELSSYTEELTCKPEHHKVLIGKNGANIRKIREKTNARIVFPNADDTDKETITIIGKKEDVLAAKKELEPIIKSLDNTTELFMSVDPVHHKYFVQRRGAVLRELQDEYAVNVSFPKQGDNSSRVQIKGSQVQIENAKQRILEIVDDLEAQVTIDVEIDQKHHRSLMGMRGTRVQEMTRVHNVQIKFPDHKEENTDYDQNGHDGEVNGSSNRRNIIRVSGRAENCEAAKEALLAAVPITIEVEVPYDLHRYIIGQKGAGVRQMMNQYDVQLVIPAADMHSDIIQINGVPTNVENAREGLLARVKDLEAEKADRELKSYKCTVDVNPIHHPRIIGRKGETIRKLREKYDVQIQLPERQSDATEGSDNIITIIGYEKNANDAKAEIANIVQEEESKVTVELDIDNRIHRRLIGQRGRAIHQFMDQYKVEVKFPGDKDENPDIVRIIGKDEYIEDAREELLAIASEFEQDLKDEEYMKHFLNPQSKSSGGGQGSAQNGGEFVVKNAPWQSQAPDTSSNASFPSLTKTAASVVANKVIWGPR